MLSVWQFGSGGSGMGKALAQPGAGPLSATFLPFISSRSCSYFWVRECLFLGQSTQHAACNQSKPAETSSQLTVTFLVVVGLCMLILNPLNCCRLCSPCWSLNLGIPGFFSFSCAPEWNLHPLWNSGQTLICTLLQYPSVAMCWGVLWVVYIGICFFLLHLIFCFSKVHVY